MLDKLSGIFYFQYLMLRCKWLYFLSFLFYTGILSGQVPDIRFEKYTAQDGLTQTSTGALLQDSHGFLWIASWGLNRYDGRVIKQYNKTGENGLADLAISSLAEDKEGNIWIGTSNGLSCLDPYTEKFTNYKEGTSPGNIPDGFCTVYVDKENNVWVGGTHGLSLYNRTTKTFENIPLTTAGNDIRINRYTGGFLEDSKRRFWISTSYGIKLFNRSTKTYRSYHFEEINGEGIAGNATQQLFEDKDGNIWAGTWNSGLLKYDEAKDRFILFPFLADDGGLQTVHGINSIILGGHYYFLIASESGLFLTDPARIMNGKAPVEKIFRETDEAGTVSSKNKWQVLKDRQGNYWISGFSGLLKIDPGSQSFQWKPLPGGNNTIDEIFHVIPDIKEPGQKVFLTTKKGWWQYDLSSQTFNAVVLPKGSEELMGNLNRFVSTEKGYWFTSAMGVGFYDVSANTVTDISSLLKTKKDNMVRTGVVCMDNSGRTWFSVYRSGLRIYDPSTKKITPLFADSSSKDDLTGKSIFDMKKLPDGTILFTNANNAFHIDPQDLSYKKIETPDVSGPGELERSGPRKILFDNKNRVLVLSWQRIYLFRGDTLLQLYPNRGVANFIMQDFLQDGNGDFWITTNLGLFKTGADFREWVNMSDKIPAGNSNTFSEFFRSPDDQFIVTAVGKIGTFSLGSLEKNKTAPTIIINRLRTGNKEQYLVSLGQKQWKVSFKDAIEIELSAINFSNEKGNRILYRLEGRDDDWKELTGRPVIRYEQLPPGSYLLNAKAANGDGVWSKETVLSFKILPPFWMTWWFIILCLLTIAAVLYAFYHYRVQQLIKEERLRSHIATDLHDDIGATLSSISIYSETIKQQTAAQLPHLTPMLEKMGETSREMVGNMSDIVWAINPENDSFEKMLGRMQNLAAELCVAKNIQLHFTADEKLNQLQLSMEQRRNIYLIFKEALNNALKYSGCANIRIDLGKEDHGLTLSVKDDGKGFSETLIAENKRGGNGLKNMRHRAKEIQGELTINSEENKGTHILLKVNIT